MRFDVTVGYAARRPWAPRRGQFASWVGAALAAGQDAALHDGAASRPLRTRVSVRVVGAAQSRTLNARYRHKDRPTNVLSFHGAGAMPDGVLHLGELVICAPVVAREAAEQGKAAAAHWAHLTVHGVLHLLGFDHEAAREARKMMLREIQILDRLGISNPYV